MPLAPLPFEALAETAMAVVNAPDLKSAIELLTSQLSALFSTRVTMFEQRGRRWCAVAGAERPSEELDWEAGLSAVASGAPTLLLPANAIGKHSTALALAGPSGPAMALVLDGDWTADHSTLRVFALLVSIGLDSLRQRDERRAAERRVVAAYGMARRLSSLTTVEQVTQEIVDRMAALLDADRVSLALYSKSDDALSIAAAHGYSHAQFKDLRIPSGAWVIGHVHAHARPIFVDDARLFPGMHHDRYRTHAFAAVPLLAGRDTVGVLSITGKRAGDRFGREDEMMLRGMSVIAALALTAARSTREAATLAHAATIDSLTNLLNRPYLDNRLREEVARSKREGTTLAVLIGDIDDFKRINDAFGHQAGDQVLRIVGGIIRSAVRVFDVCARYGGDEVAILMPNCDLDSAVACAERIRRLVAEHDGPAHGTAPLTMSIGVAVIEKDEDAAALMARADQYLYQAKADGKNLVRSSAGARAWRRNGAAPVLAAAPPRRESPAWLLIADADDKRAALCAAIARRLGITASVARSSHDALNLIAQSGPPSVLIIDLSVPPAGGFAVIAALDDDDRSEIIAWSDARAITEYASRQAWPNARVLNGRASEATIRTAVENVLDRHAPFPMAQPPAASPPPSADTLVRALADRARQLCRTAGVAVCVRMPGETGFRTFVDWTSDESMPHLPYAVPRAVDRVIETGRTIPDTRGLASLDAIPQEALDDTTRGLAAVPILLDNQVAGAICIFDVKPLALADRDVAALAAIGREALAHAAAPAAALPAAPPRFADRAADRMPAGAAGQPAPQIEWPPAILERRGGEFAVARELARARREGRQLSVVLFDVGPAVADAASSQQVADEQVNAVADTLLRTIRQSDLPIRWNVSELLVVLPGLTGNEARSVAERVRAALQAGARNRLRVSGGVAELENDERFADVVERARQKVAMAVGRGHNRVL